VDPGVIWAFLRPLVWAKYAWDGGGDDYPFGDGYYGDGDGDCYGEGYNYGHGAGDHDGNSR